MIEADIMMKEQFTPFYQRVFDAFKQNHHTFFSILSSFLSGKKNHIGIRVTENEKVIGEYTLYLEGAAVSHLDSGVLASEVHSPFGVIRPYIILEKSTVERMIADEQSFIKDLFATKLKYSRDATIKFL